MGGIFPAGVFPGVFVSGYTDGICATCSFFLLVLLFVDDDIKMARKPGKKREENPVGCAGEGKRCKGNRREELREGKTGTVLELSLDC